MSRQVKAREEIQRCFSQLLTETLVESLVVTQNLKSAEVVFAVVWPDLKPEHMIALDGRDESFLIRAGSMPDGLRDELAARMARRAAEKFSSSGSGVGRGTSKSALGRSASGGGFRFSTSRNRPFGGHDFGADVVHQNAKRPLYRRIEVR
jgi:hypothetical protein